MKKFKDITSNEDYIDELKNQFGIESDETKQFELHKLYSKYWMDCLPNDNENLISLVSFRRAVANFVKINTLSAGIDKPIAVRFTNSNDSYTDTEKYVVLSAKIDNKDFDAVVGLALHESNHVIDTDGNVNFRLLATADELKENGKSSLPLSDNLLKEITRLKMDESTVRLQVNEVRNWIEDRRIDQNGWKRSPGYRPYYKATYDKYYGNIIFKLALQSKMFREMDWESYKFRMFNILNPSSDLNALPGLNKISEMLSGDNISQLTSNYDSTMLSMKILALMYSYFKDDQNKSNSNNKNENQENSEKGTSSGKSTSSDSNGEISSSDSNDSEGGTEPEKGEKNDDEKNADTDKDNKDSEDTTNYGDNPVDNKKNENENSPNKDTDKDTENKKDLNKGQIRQLEKALQQQLDYIAGKTKKETLTAKEIDLLDAIDKSNTTIEKVQGDVTTGMNVMVVRNLTKAILNGISIGTYTPYRDSASGVIKGIQLGKMLATKLQIRNDNKLYKSKHKTSGKIDKRLLYSIGFGDTSVFEKTKIDQFGDAIVHISVDASGSMQGSGWTETMTAITAIAYAASQVKNLDVIISFRSTVHGTPLMVIAYDSRKDNFVKIKNLFPYIKPCSNTPEGLCYEAVMKDILNDAAGKIGYFINFSDGYPNMVNGKNKKATTYAPEIAKIMVDKMRSVGIRVLAFFIGEGYAFETFKYMYGKDSKEISITELYPLAKELNKMFATQKN